MIAPRFLLFALASTICLNLAWDTFAKSKPARAKSSTAKSTPAPTATPNPDQAKANASWNVIKVGARDYLSAENIAKFYELLGNVDSTGKIVVLNNGRNQLQLTLNSREAIVNGVRNWLCFPVIAHDDKFLVSRIDLAKTLEPQLRPQMIQRKDQGKLQTVVLDAGHGGFDKGARSESGNEKEFALDVARRLRALLQAKGFKVILTRENDVFLPLELRARIANQTRDSIFVSLHFNATDNREATGFEIYSLTPRGAPSTADDSLALRFANMQAGSAVDAASFELSVAVFHSMLGHIQAFDRGIKRARFAVVRQTKIPSILIEGGFLSNTADRKLIANAAWRGKLADAISVGIENYRDVTEGKQRPMLAADYRAQDASGITLHDLAQPPGSLDSSPVPTIIPVSNIDADPGHEE